MKKILIPFLALTICFACKDDTKKTVPEVSPMVKKSRERTRTSDKTPTSIKTDSPEIKNSISNTNESESSSPSFNLSAAVTDFISCKSNATERTQCRNQITKVISETYHISDFEDSKLGYVLYDSIRPIIERSNKWRRLGSALQQNNIDKAMDNTNNGGLSLIIDTSQVYGHVVMVVPGKATKSSSWNLQLPTVLSLLNYKPEKSFNDKSLSYALKKSNDLQVYIRK